MTNRPMDIDDVVLSILREMTRMPVALKAWKAPVIDLFNDNRFFNSFPDEAEPWKPVIKSLFDSDRTAFPELLCKWLPYHFDVTFKSPLPLLSQNRYCGVRQHFRQ